jgi:hypothetical protein
MSSVAPISCLGVRPALGPALCRGRLDATAQRPIVEAALATLALAKARLEEATAPEPVRFDRPRRVALRPVIETTAPDEVVQLRKIYNPPPIVAGGLLSIFA